MGESQEELLGAVTVAPTPERGVVTVAGATLGASEGKGSEEERCTSGHSTQELPTTLAHMNQTCAETFHTVYFALKKASGQNPDRDQTVVLKR